MVWCLLRVLCCLCANRELCCCCSSSNNSNPSGYRYVDDSDYSTDDEYPALDYERKKKLVRTKQAAIAATTDMINVKRLLHKHGGESGLLMYYDRHKAAAKKAYGRLAAATGYKHSTKPSRVTRAYSRGDVV